MGKNRKRSRRGTKSKAESLITERAERYRELGNIYRNFSTWSIGIGKLKISASVGTQAIAVAFVAWHVLAAVAGIVLTIIWKEKELGVALIVGALFGIGSFMAQFWSQAMDTQREFIEKVLHEDDVNELRATIDRLMAIEREIRKRTGGNDEA
jgi:hypothetical protein